MSTRLTKKQQKALTFRAKQKAKRSGRAEAEQEDVPEQDLEEDEVVDAVVVAEGSGKKRRRHEEDQTDEGAKNTETSKRKANQTAWDEEGDGAGRKSKKEVKQRFILFVGNFDYKTTREDVQAHFQPAIGHIPAVRLLTDKPKKPSASHESKPTNPKSRGIAFLELATSLELQACLKLHHSALQGRKINVELTAGGGGKGEGRKEKIRVRNERVGGQRERRAEKEKEAGVGEEGVGVVQAQERGAKPLAEVGPDGAKIRGGRRVKAKSNNQLLLDGEPLAKRPRPAFVAPYGGDRQHRPSAQSARPYPPRRPKWEPTGANAVIVG